MANKFAALLAFWREQESGADNTVSRRSSSSGLQHQSSGRLVTPYFTYKHVLLMQGKRPSVN
jgi:hypothetical protein